MRDGAEWSTESGPWLQEVLAEAGRPPRLPKVTRGRVDVGGGQGISVLRWGESPPELLLAHGGGQNAHTWDLVLAALDRPAVAVDLPGHGHSDWRADGDYSPRRNAESLVRVLDALQLSHELDIVGMSLGGLTSICLTASAPECVSSITVVDVTPSVHLRTPALTRRQRGTTALIQGPRTFASQEEMVRLAVEASPGRPVAAVRRGVVHNTRRLDDGSWTWRYDRLQGMGDFSDLWADVDRVRAKTMLVRGGASSFVPDVDVDEFIRRQSGLRVEVVRGAGHSVQSDAPMELAQLLQDFHGVGFPAPK